MSLRFRNSILLAANVLSCLGSGTATYFSIQIKDDTRSGSFSSVPFRYFKKILSFRIGSGVRLTDLARGEQEMSVINQSYTCTEIVSLKHTRKQLNTPVNCVIDSSGRNTRGIFKIKRAGSPEYLKHHNAQLANKEKAMLHTSAAKT